MQRRQLAQLAAVALALATAPAAPRAGLAVTTEEPAGPSSMELEGQRVRIEHGAPRPQVTLFDGEAQVLYQLDPEARLYTKLTPADVKAVAAQLREALAQLPPEARARAEANLTRRAEQQRETRYEPTGTHQVVAGFRCDGYRVVRPGQPDEEGCFIPWAVGVVTKDDLAPLVALGRFMEELVVGAYGGVARGAGGSFQMAEELQRAPGFPAAVERVEGERRVAEHRLTALRRAPIPPERFRVPAGYRLDPSAGAAAGPERRR